jgi:hypothetical protein
MKLYEVAHSRSGDKGNISTISVIVYDYSDYDFVKQRITESRVLRQFSVVGATKVDRYELPQLGALNFVISNSLGGGVTRSLALDTHGKSFSSLMLEMEL